MFIFLVLTFMVFPKTFDLDNEGKHRKMLFNFNNVYKMKKKKGKLYNGHKSKI